MDFTMLRQLCRRGRLNIILQDGRNSTRASTLPVLSFLKTLEEPDNDINNNEKVIFSEPELAYFLAKMPKMSPPIYRSILQYMTGLGQQWHPYDLVPAHPDRFWILSPRARMPTSIVSEGKTYSCQSSHLGNSAIHFYDSHDHSKQHTGFIETICQLPIHKILRTFLLIWLHQNLPPALAQLSPYNMLPGLKSRVVEKSPHETVIVIEPHHIITQLTLLQMPAGTFGIPREIFIICWALNRGRK